MSRTALNKLCNDLLKDESVLVRIEAIQALLILGPPYAPEPAEYVKLVQPYANVVAERLKEDGKGEKDEMARLWLMLLGCMYDDRTMDTAIAKMAVADPASVAAAGVDAMLAGKDHVVPGVVNKLAVASSKALPDAAVARAQAPLTKPRSGG